MTANQRWTIWLSLLAATLGATVWVSQESEGDIVAPAKERLAGPASPLASDERAPPRPSLPAGPKATTQPASASSQSSFANPFAARSWYVAPPPPPPEPPAKPTAPPLPFRYLGTLESGDGEWLVQIARGDEGIVAGKGEVIGDIYRLEGLEQGNLVFTYLPLGTRQSLPAFLDSD